MKWLGCAWRRLLTVSVVLATTAPARADDAGVARLGLIGDPTMRPIAPRVLSPGAPIPANGGILIEGGTGSLVTAVVTNPRGEIVEGTTTLLSSGQELSYYVWMPAGELGLGAHWVDLRNDGGASIDMILIEIVEAAERVWPALTLSPSLAAFTAPSLRACCTTPQDGETNLCALSEQQTFARLDPGLSSMETVGTLNQYLYRIRATGGVEPTGVEAFGAFGAPPALYFEAAAEEYCFEADVLDIATMEVRHEPDLAGCISGSSVQPGTMPIEIDDAFLAQEQCLQPPPGHEEQWCKANASDCAHGLNARCVRFRYACEDGPLPTDWEVHPPDDETEPPEVDGSPRDAGPEPPARADGCSVAAPGAERRGASSPSALGALLLLLPVLWIGLASNRHDRVADR